MKSRNSSAVETVTVGPPAPPVVPFWPSAFTEAKPMGPGVGGGGSSSSRTSMPTESEAVSAESEQVRVNT